jgi:hypothetical protein
MFSAFNRNTKNSLIGISSSIPWILNNKTSIAILALVMTADAANAAINRRILFNLECGSFEMVRNDALTFRFDS